MEGLGGMGGGEGIEVLEEGEGEVVFGFLWGGGGVVVVFCKFDEGGNGGKVINNAEGYKLHGDGVVDFDGQ